MPRQGWREQAACRGEDPDIFEAVYGRAKPEAFALCGGCPVRGDCLAFEAPFERTEPQAGSGTIFAGMTRPQRADWYAENPGPVITRRDIFADLIGGGFTIEADEPNKLCRSCDQWLPRDAFAARTKARDGLQPHCRDCNADYKLTLKRERAIAKRARAEVAA